MQGGVDEGRGLRCWIGLGGAAARVARRGPGRYSQDQEGDGEPGALHFDTPIV